jgi:hypothetical protein
MEQRGFHRRGSSNEVDGLRKRYPIILEKLSFHSSRVVSATLLLSLK